MAALTTILFSVLMVISAVKGEDKPCDAKQFDDDSVVCVCTEDYCDSINPELPSSGQYLKITSDKNGSRFEYNYGYKNSIVLERTGDSCSRYLLRDATILEVKRSETGQTIKGFGGAISDAVGLALNNLTEELRDILLESYYAADGLKYNLLRTTIGHCDFSPSVYYYTNVTDDVNMTSWNLTYADYNYRLPYILKANEIAEDEVLMMASVWTVPEWMRTVGPTGQKNIVLEEYYDAYSLYIIKYLQAFKDEGIEFWGVNYANEPTVTTTTGYTNNENFFTVWTMITLARFVVESFGPALKEYGFNDTKIVFFEDMRAIMLTHWVAIFYAVDGIEDYFDTIGLHSYLNKNVTASTVDYFHTIHPNVTIITSELSAAGTTEGIKLGAWSTAEFYATNYLEELNTHHSAWIDWNLALNEESTPNLLGTSSDAPIVVMAEEKSFYKQPSYYAIGHFSKWIPRNSTYVTLETAFATVLQYGAVIRPDGLITAVVQNTSNHTISLTIRDEEGAINIDITPYSINTLIF